MRILAIVNESPYPVNNGQRARTSLFLEGLSRSHEVDLVIQDYRGEEFSDALGEVLVFHSTDPQRLNQAAGLLLNGDSMYLTKFRNPMVEAGIRKAATLKRYDRIYCLGLPAMANLPSDLDVPIWLDEQNLEYRIYEGYGKVAGSGLKRLIAGWEAKALKRWEMLCLERADNITVCSEMDRSRLPDSAKVKTVVVENTVTYEGAVRMKASYNQRAPHLIYSGTMNWEPNVDACRYFVKEIYPLIKAVIPEATFTIVGRGPTREILDMAKADSSIKVTGEVPDPAVFLSQASVAVVPLRMGSGTRVKILEAAQIGLPVVSTHLGSEGLGMRDGEEILLADDKFIFRDQVLALLENAALWERVSSSSRAMYQSRYSREHLRQLISALA